jgi:hypothetical protein
MRINRVGISIASLLFVGLFVGCQSEETKNSAKVEQGSCSGSGGMISPDQLTYEYDKNCAPKIDSYGNYIFKRDRIFMIGDQTAVNDNGIPMTQAEGETIYEIGEDGYAKLDALGNPILKRSVQSI